MAPVMALFAGLYLDDIADLVERRDYPQHPPGTPLPTTQAILTGVRFGLLVLVVTLALLPTLLLGIGAVAMVLANAYLLGREYFEMVAARHMPADEARRLRKENAPRVLAAGFIPAFLVVVPFVNIITPIFSTIYFVHIFKQIRNPAGALR
jgi:CysZ protein